MLVELRRAQTPRHLARGIQTLLQTTDKSARLSCRVLQESPLSSPPLPIPLRPSTPPPQPPQSKHQCPWWLATSAIDIVVVTNIILYLSVLKRVSMRLRSRGNKVASRMLGSLSMRAVKRSRPVEHPPCGGIPTLKAWR